MGSSAEAGGSYLATEIDKLPVVDSIQCPCNYSLAGRYTTALYVCDLRKIG